MSAAISNAKSGDTVIIPAGSATWASQLIITKEIILKGAGIDVTTITAGYVGTGGTTYLKDSAYLIPYHPAHPEQNNPFRMSGFTLNCNHNVYGLFLNNPTTHKMTKVRFDHLKVINLMNGTHGLFRYGPIYGCCDQCQIEGDQNHYDLNGTAWTNQTFSFGSPDNFYMEDDIITSQGNIDSYGPEGGLGGRYCYRYCTINVNYNGYVQPFDIHGNNGNYATMGAEIYNNTINALVQGISGGQFVDHRGGMALVFNNNVVSSSSSFIVNVREEYADNDRVPSNGPTGQPQHISSSYYWNNMVNGVAIPGGGVTPPSRTGLGYNIMHQVDYNTTTLSQTRVSCPPMAPFRLVPQWDLDCWCQAAGTFNGSTGIGIGLLAARPVSATTLGVGYWATDRNTLYTWNGSAWTTFYTPYTYPHPLRSDPVIGD